MAKRNGRDLSDTDIFKIKEIVSNVETDSKQDSNLNPLHMFQGDLLCKTLIMVVCWITVCFGFYALTLNATQVGTFLSNRKLMSDKSYLEY
jgi:hypothetical protein